MNCAVSGLPGLGHQVILISSPVEKIAKHKLGFWAWQESKTQVIVANADTRFGHHFVLHFSIHWICTILYMGQTQHDLRKGGDVMRRIRNIR